MNWLIKFFTGREFLPLTSYDDLIPLNEIEYHYEKLNSWLSSCKDESQMGTILNAIELFKKEYPEQKALSQHLYLKYWQIKRSFINN